MIEEEELRKKLRERADEFLEAIREEVDSCVLLLDAERLSGLTGVVAMYLDSQLIRSLREKGLSEDIRKLCDKAGRIKRP